MGSEPKDSNEHDVGPITGFPQGEPVAVEVGRRRLAVVRDGDRVFALRDVCPHQGAALSAGRVISTCRLAWENDRWVQTDLHVLQCPWHGWSFGLDDGQALFADSGSSVRSYSARVAGGRVRVRMER